MIHLTTNTLDLFVIAVYVRAGAIFEDPAQAGISHLLEHLLFRTKKNMSPTNLLKRLERIGGKYNAATSKDVTYFYLSTSGAHWQEAVQLMHSIVFDLHINQKDLEHEIEICKEELYKGVASEDLLDQFLIPAMFKQSIYEKSVIGTKASLESIKLSDVQEYYRNHYNTCHITVSCSPALKTKVNAQLIQVFKPQLGPPCPMLKYDYLAAWNGHVIEAAQYKYSSLHVCYKFLPYDTRAYAVIQLITYILNGGLESILTSALREEEKAVYSCTMFPISFFGAGVLLFSATTSAETLKVHDRYLTTIHTFCKEFITRSAFKQYKDNFMLRQKLASNNTMDITISLGLDYYYTNVPKTWQSFNKLMQAITYEEVRDTARFIFSQPSITLLTSEKKMPANYRTRVWDRFHKHMNKMEKLKPKVQSTVKLASNQ